MAKSQTETGFDFIDDEEGWETIVEESGQKLAFTNPGEQFTGTFVGNVTIQNPKADREEDKTFDQQRFRDSDGTLYAMNGGFKLLEGLKGVEPGTIVRITYMGEIDTGQPSPMKDYRVEARKVASPQPGTVKATDTGGSAES